MNKVTTDRIYLDKMVSLPHLPKSLGTSGIPFNVAPDLSHTGIQTKFNAPIDRVLMPNGGLHESYVSKTTEKTRNLSRTLLALQNKKPSYVRAHGRTIDNMLLSMAETKETNSKTFHEDLLIRKSQLGLTRPSTQQSTVCGGERKPTKSCGPKPRVRKVYDNKSLFEYLLDSVETPAEPKKSFASLSRPQTASDWDQASLSRIDFEDVLNRTS